LITANEVDFSKDFADQYYLYRVFDFAQNPKLYIIRGDLQKLCLQPTVFEARF
jgi:hypothetical protein